MEENTVIAFRSPTDFQEDPLTEVLQAGAHKLLAQAKTAMSMVFKLCQSAQKKWRKLNGSNHLAEIIRGLKFVDGERQDRAAA